MRKIFVITAVIISLSQIMNAQFKDIPAETKTKLKSSNLWFGFINPKNFSLKRGQLFLQFVHTHIKHLMGMSCHRKSQRSLSLNDRPTLPQLTQVAP